MPDPSWLRRASSLDRRDFLFGLLDGCRSGLMPRSDRAAIRDHVTAARSAGFLDPSESALADSLLSRLDD